MIDNKEFRAWLKENTPYSPRVITDIVSRAKRVDNILEWNSDEAYLFYLEKNEDFSKLSSAVKSQMRKAIKLYANYKTEK